MRPPGAASAPDASDSNSPAPTTVTSQAPATTSNPSRMSQAHNPVVDPSVHPTADSDPQRVTASPPPHETEAMQLRAPAPFTTGQATPQSTTGWLQFPQPILSGRTLVPPTAAVGDLLNPGQQSMPYFSQPRPIQVRLPRSPDLGMEESADTTSSHSRLEPHRDSHVPNYQPQQQLDTPGSSLGNSRRPTRRVTNDWVWVDERLTVGKRIAPTLQTAREQRLKSLAEAKRIAWALNIAIGLQLILGSLTTGLSAVATTGKQTAVQTTVLGALTTLVASILARARGTGEPDTSQSRAKNLDRFIREVESFDLDHGQEANTTRYDEIIDEYRQHLEQILGNAKKDPNSRVSPGSTPDGKAATNDYSDKKLTFSTGYV